jgi:polyisoprenoid-binding protein YceI
MAPRTLALAGLLSALAAAPAEARRYQIVAGESRMVFHVGRAGMFKGLGHDHAVAARAFSGYVELDDAEPARGRVTLTVDGRRLQVLPDGEPPKDVPQVQQTMLGPKVLDAQRFPRITVTSRRASARPIAPHVLQVQLTCDVELHGVVRPVSFPVRVEITGDRVVARGTITLRQTDFGIRPLRIAGGTIKVKDEVTGQFTLVGRAVDAVAPSTN